MSVATEAELAGRARELAGETGLARATWRRDADVEVVAVASPPPFEPARAHDGWDLAAFAQASDLPAALTVFAWSSGEQASERRSHVRCADGELVRAATRADAAFRLRAELDALPPADEFADLDGEVVLGPDAVAQVLGALRDQLGLLDERRGTRVASSAVNLSDSPRFASTLPQSLRLDGVVRRPSPLIQDGVSMGVPAQRPDHLVLVGGGAADLHELTRGGGVPLLRRLDAVPDALALLARVQALTARQSTIPHGTDPAAVTATVCPAVRLAPVAT